MHLFWQCPIALAVWSQAAGYVGCNSIHPTNWSGSSKSAAIISKMISNAPAEHSKAIKTMVIIILAAIWKERNECTFRNKKGQAQDIKEEINRTLRLWRDAGAVHLEHPFGEPP